MLTDGTDSTDSLQTWVLEADIGSGSPLLSLKPRPSMIMFTGTLTSAAAATPVTLISDAKVGAGRKIAYMTLQYYVNGATNWATTTYIAFQDTAGSPVEYSRIVVGSNATNGLAFGSIGQTPTAVQVAGAGFTGLTGLTQGKGLVMKGDQVGTGSNLIVSGYAIVVPV